ncbi:MAG: hypothetical protein ABIJ34_05705 [archaeon]
MRSENIFFRGDRKYYLRPPVSVASWLDSIVNHWYDLEGQQNIIGRLSKQVTFTNIESNNTLLNLLKFAFFEIGPIVFEYGGSGLMGIDNEYTHMRKTIEEIQSQRLDISQSLKLKLPQVVVDQLNRDGYYLDGRFHDISTSKQASLRAVLNGKEISFSPDSVKYQFSTMVHDGLLEQTTTYLRETRFGNDPILLQRLKTFFQSDYANKEIIVEWPGSEHRYRDIFHLNENQIAVSYLRTPYNRNTIHMPSCLVSRTITWTNGKIEFSGDYILPSTYSHACIQADHSLHVLQNDVRNITGSMARRIWLPLPRIADALTRGH